MVVEDELCTVWPLVVFVFEKVCDFLRRCFFWVTAAGPDTMREGADRCRGHGMATQTHARILERFPTTQPAGNNSHRCNQGKKGTKTRLKSFIGNFNVV